MPKGTSEGPVLAFLRGSHLPRACGCFAATNLGKRKSLKGRERILSQLPDTGRSPLPLNHAFLSETLEGVVRKTNPRGTAEGMRSERSLFHYSVSVSFRSPTVSRQHGSDFA
jgi:hypothetical protein